MTLEQKCREARLDVLAAFVRRTARRHTRGIARANDVALRVYRDRLAA